MSVSMLVGFPACGKSSVTKKYSEQGYSVLNRDSEGGSLSDLLPDFERLLADGKSVVLDNTNISIEARKPFIELSQKYNTPIEAIHLDTSLEDCQINALHRMWDRYGMIFYTADDIKRHPEAKKDSNVFPIAALFSRKKQFEKPTTAEGFSKVTKIKFERKPLGPEYKNAAVIFDYDGTLRDVKPDSPYKYPVKPSEIYILPNRSEKIKKLLDDGILVFGLSNQSGIAKKHLSVEEAVECFNHTNSLLGVSIDVKFCSHSIPPLSCYCRKPSSGIGVELIRKYKLDPSKVTMVGDLTTDETFANRLGFTYVDQAEYFK